MIFKRSAEGDPRTPDLAGLVAELEQGVAARDGARVEAAFNALGRTLQQSGDEESAAAGPRLAALIPGFPPTGPRAVLAVMSGACVERGADAAACAEPILDGALNALRDAARFADLWRGSATADLPAPDEMNDAVIEGFAEAAQLHPMDALVLALAWIYLDEWQMAALAVLSRGDAVRRGLGERRTELLAAVETVAALDVHDLKCLAYALLVLDDEPLVVLHRPTGTGYRVRISGIGDNFQLHTLLAHALIGGGHLPGKPPAAEVVAVSLDRELPEGARLDTEGAFNLVSPDGSWIWNEGTPSDIPVVDGVRLLVLDPPPYPRGWNAGRFFPNMPASLALEAVLPPTEAADWFAHVKPASPKGT
ncbi:hypothetical protein [Streptacidiphilus monticola]|uniref:Uncharacterized protein n=1 Tax=Streptacidiphilus monticola TaxID=2161674 RepID=A0ABW1G6C2_9ACTN